MATISSQPALKRDPDGFLNRSVQDLISLKGRTVVITGGARGLGLAFAFAVAEAGGNVAIIDALDKPHDHFYLLQQRFDVKVQFYKCGASPSLTPSLPIRYISELFYTRKSQQWGGTAAKESGLTGAM
jgi:hypothetical protein